MVHDVFLSYASKDKPSADAAHPKQSRNWLTLSPTIVLLTGLFGLIVGCSPTNSSPDTGKKPDPDSSNLAHSFDKNSEQKVTPTVTNSTDKKSASDLYPFVTNSIGMKLVFVKPGAFLMGFPVDEKDHRHDEHQHEVEITRPFSVGVYEVTQEQYERVMGENPSWFSPKGRGQEKVTGMDTRQFPVERVSWQDASKFCRQLSELPEEKAKAHTYRLPTEAEWEYVCRGGPFFKKPSPPFYFGNSLSSAQANFDGNSPYGDAAKGQNLQRTAKVGSYPANPLGLFDLHGNVWEWCADWYDAEYYKHSPRQDPQGPENGQRRVLRGGSWGNSGGSCRAAYRLDNAPGDRELSVGFRVVLVVGARK